MQKWDGKRKPYTGWAGARPDDPELAEAFDLLDELLIAFGLEAEQARIKVAGLGKARRGRLQLLSDADIDADAIARETLLALPKLRELIAELRALRSGPLPSVERYGVARQGIVDRWNAWTYDNGTVLLPQLCEMCGKPVLARANSRASKGGPVEFATVCGDACFAARKSRRVRRANKKP